MNEERTDKHDVTYHVQWKLSPYLRVQLANLQTLELDLAGWSFCPTQSDAREHSLDVRTCGALCAD